MIQIRMPGITLTIASVACPSQPSHDVGEDTTSSGMLKAVAEACATAAAFDAVLSTLFNTELAGADWPLPFIKGFRDSMASSYRSCHVVS